ncbi:LytR/AlgR family response regulator transcription factor [Puia dinghuensis]|uniref:DNA-binding response regulator n=1 Tax=Puia dinghuensis TaxID=1792502 RepID=A0A8J2UEM5_9BACT|nr:LytTR family DNA-binding domain-containing protein [Puia dinghuensis]GGB06092.1 DNA-binding response regulator [Puia dinghuensis]
MTQETSAFIVDDEYQSRLVIAQLLSRYFPGIQILGQAGSVAEATEGIRLLRPQVIFLDVQMQGETGFEVLDQLPESEFEIIFTTAHQEYAVKAFRYSAIDYLIKPIDPPALAEATQKAINKIRLQRSRTAEQLQVLHQQINPGQKFTNKIAVPTSEGLQFLPVQDIIYCQGQGNYTEIFLVSGQKITSSHTLRSYEEMLGGQHFFRAHKSFLINLLHIEKYLRGEGGIAVMSNGSEIEIARRNKTSFLNLFKG